MNDVSTSDQLTDKQQRFVDEYLIDLHVERAAIRASFELRRCSPRAKFYVYFLVDSRNHEIFYVGKGTATRYAQHIRDWRNGETVNPKKHRRISEIVAAGGSVDAYFLAVDLNECTAFRRERETIRSIGLERLTNWGPGCVGRADRDIASAQAMLARFKSFEEWRAGRLFPPWYSAIYHQVHAHLGYIASGQYAEDCRKCNGLEYA
jgi:hypothetical protein